MKAEKNIYGKHLKSTSYNLTCYDKIIILLIAGLVPFIEYIFINEYSQAEMKDKNMFKWRDLLKSHQRELMNKIVHAMPECFAFAVTV